MSRREIEAAINKMFESSMPSYKVARQKIIDELGYPHGKRSIHFENIKGWGTTIRLLDSTGEPFDI